MPVKSVSHFHVMRFPPTHCVERCFVNFPAFEDKPHKAPQSTGPGTDNVVLTQPTK